MVSIARPIVLFAIIGTMLLVNSGYVSSASSDLALENIWWAPQQPVFAGPLTVVVDVKNVGDSPSSDSYTLMLYVDGWGVGGWLVPRQYPTLSPTIAPGQTQTWHWNISDWTVFKDGDHEVKAVVKESNDPNATNDVLTKTLKISSSDHVNDFNIFSYGMCKGLDKKTSQAADITDNYKLTDDHATLFLYTDLKQTSEVYEKIVNTGFTLKFYSPNGTLHRDMVLNATTTTYLFQMTQQKDENGRPYVIVYLPSLFINKDYSGYGGPGQLINDPPYQALNNYPGIWRAEAWNKGRLLFVKRFIVGDASKYTLTTTSTVTSSSTSISSSLNETALTTEQTQTPMTTATEIPPSEAPGGLVTIVGAIVALAVLAAGAVLMKRKKK